MLKLKITALCCAIFAVILHVLSASGCADSRSDLGDNQGQINVLNKVSADYSAKRSIATVDALLGDFSKSSGGSGPKLNGKISALNNDDLFRQTQTGSYLNDLSKSNNNMGKIGNISGKVLTYLFNSRECRSECGDEFKNLYKNNRDKLQNRLSNVAAQVVANEIPNSANYVAYYHGFPNRYRLLQDVLRAVKSFELLKPLNDTYMFRDFSFDDKTVNLEEFLRRWWFEYKKYAKELKVPLYPTRGFESPGFSSGLTFFPDAFLYAQSHLISANLSFFGNTVSPLNSTIFFFLNSTSATGLDIADMLIKKTLSPYVKKLPDGSEDTAKLASVLKELDAAFAGNMSASGGQLAQIFLRDDAAKDISFVAWNGGHPVWFSKGDNRIVFARSERTNKPLWRPINIFWPNQEESKKIYMPDISRFVGTFIENPGRLAHHFFPVNGRVKIKFGAKFLGVAEDSEKNKVFLSRDLTQARILPNPNYLSNPNIAKVKMYTANEVSPESEKNYEAEVFAIVRNLMSDFLATAKEADFKPGKFALKNLFFPSPPRKD